MPHGKFKIEIEPQAVNGPGAGNISVGISQQENDWIVNNETGETCFSWREIGREVEMQLAEEPMVLYRARASRVKVLSRDSDGHADSWTTENIEGPCEGFLLWVSTSELHR